MKISDLKQEAKVNLQGKWGKAILIAIVYYLINFVLGMIGQSITNNVLEIIYSVLLIIINVPFAYGYIASLVKLSRNENVSPLDFITIGLQSFKNSWMVIFRTVLKMLLPIFLVIVSYMILFLSAILTFKSNSSSFLLIIAFILLFGSYIYAFIKGLSYTLTSYVLYDNQDLSGKEIVEKSSELMKNNKWNYIKLSLSFLLYYIVIMIVYAILYQVANSIIAVVFALIAIIGVSIYLLPYLNFALIAFYEKTQEKDEE